ncbi:patatin-like phospholipase family protein [Methylomonas sp. MgM2]
MGIFSMLGKILFLDLPWALDRAMRHTEFWINTRYMLEPDKSTKLRNWKWRPPFVLSIMLSVMLVFTLYGPTFDSLCAVFPHPYTTLSLGLVFVFLSISLFYCVYQMVDRGWKLIERRKVKLVDRIPNLPTHEITIRFGVMVSFLVTLIVILLLPFALLLVAIVETWNNTGTCAGVTFNFYSLLQLIFAFLLVLTAIHAARPFSVIPKIPQEWLWTPLCFYLSIISLFIIIILGYDKYEAQHSPYVTAFSVLAVLLVGLAYLLSFFLPKWVLADLSKLSDFKLALRNALARCELFVAPPEPELNNSRILYSLTAPLSSPLLLLLIPSFYVLVSNRSSLSLGAFFVAALWWLIMSMGNISASWNQQLTLFRRWFLTGLPMGISLLVITLSVCRFKDIEYVSYVIDAAPFGVVTMTVVMFYALAWTLEGCLHRPLQLELFGLLSDKNIKNLDSCQMFVEYNLSEVIDTDVKVKLNERRLQPHGSARFAVVGRLLNNTSRPAFHTYSNTELFTLLVENEKKYLPLPDYKKLESHLHELRRRIRNYFVITNLAVVGIIILFIGCTWQSDGNLIREPIAEVTADALPEHPFELLKHLQQKGDSNKPAILIAASGGGTRAALYTTAALQGLTRIGLGQDIVLTSGVSGGGVSLAYFASHREQLLSSHKVPNNWTTFIDAMSFNHIQEVLQGFAEWRLVRRVGLAQLLVESFDRQFDKQKGGKKTLGDLQDVGLILNTTIAAHPATDSTFLTDLFASPTSVNSEDMVFTRLEGGRLIFTNLSNTSICRLHDNLERKIGINSDIDLTYKIVRDPSLPIPAVAALNANFPPVFANSGVWEIDRQKKVSAKYYVTDGGVNENRGLISLLYALHSTLRQWTSSKPVDIHIIVLDASAFSIDYDEDRGIHNLFAGTAQERLASGLERQLLVQICRAAELLNGKCVAESGEKAKSGPFIHMHYLPMPPVLAMRGGFGTHWMLPETVSVTNPRDPKPISSFSTTRELSAAQIKTFTQCLFAVKDTFPQLDCTQNGSLLPEDWLAGTEQCLNESGDKSYCVTGWKRLVQELHG